MVAQLESITSAGRTLTKALYSCCQVLSFDRHSPTAPQQQNATNTKKVSASTHNLAASETTPSSSLPLKTYIVLHYLDYTVDLISKGFLSAPTVTLNVHCI